MTDTPQQPPSPSAFPPPSPTEMNVSPEAPTSGKRPRIIAAGVGAVAIVAAATFAVTRVSGNDDQGGASEPEAVADELIAALNDEDMLGVLDLLAPNERETLVEPFQRFTSEMQRIEVVDPSASLSDIDGLDITIDPDTVETTVSETNADDIVNLQISFTGTAELDGSALPVGDLIRDRLNLTDEQLDELDTSTRQEDGDVVLPLTAVNVDGRWYLSVFYSAAELARASAYGSDVPPIPDEPVALRGVDDPEAAVEQFLTDAASLDAERVIGDLNPEEFEALQRYAPLFLDDVEQAADAVDSQVSIDKLDLSSSGSGESRSVRINSFSVSVDIEGDSGTVELTPDGCFLATLEGETEGFDSCALAGQLPAVGEILEDPTAVEAFIDTFKKAFADYENPWITVRQVDGKWYVSPLATGSEQVLAVLEALTREEIENMIDTGTEAVESVIEQIEQDQVDFDTIDIPGLDEESANATVSSLPDDLYPDPAPVTTDDNSTAPVTTDVDKGGSSVPTTNDDRPTKQYPTTGPSTTRP